MPRLLAQLPGVVVHGRDSRKLDSDIITQINSGISTDLFAPLSQRFGTAYCSASSRPTQLVFRMAARRTVSVGAYRT